MTRWFRRASGHPQEAHEARMLAEQERLGAIGRMAAGIAHDLNNSLAPVVGFSELLLNDVANGDGTLSARQREWLELIHRGALDAAGTVARLREVYRPRAAQDDYQPVDVVRLMEQVVALTRPKWHDDALAAGKSITILADTRPATPAASAPEGTPERRDLSAIGDAAELREALTNLVFNAADAILDNGTIVLRCHETLNPTGRRMVVLEVQDTGTGMTEEDQARCLEPFFTTKGERGTGLGLSLVHGTAQRHGGSIEVESQPRVGTTVRLVLPAAEPTELVGAPVGPEATAAAEPRRLRVLVVDDEPAVRGVIEAYLRTDDHVVETADGPQAAIRSVGRGGPFDLVITDRAMPGLSGEALAVWIKRRTPDVPVIMVTGYGELMKAAGERPEGVDAVLSKPVTLGALRGAIEQLVGLTRV